MFGWSTIERQRRRIIREDRKFLEARVRRLLTNYLSATETQKPRYFEVVAAEAWDSSRPPSHNGNLPLDGGVEPTISRHSGIEYLPALKTL
jgi:hypothetical protein